jgi:hypothetical protein
MGKGRRESGALSGFGVAVGFLRNGFTAISSVRLKD